MRNFVRSIFVMVALSTHATSIVNPNKMLLCAAAEGNWKVFRELVDHNLVDVNYDGGTFGMTALHYALINGKYREESCRIARHLIRHGANKKIRGGYPPVSAKQLIQFGFCKGKL